MTTKFPYFYHRMQVAGGIRVRPLGVTKVLYDAPTTEERIAFKRQLRLLHFLCEQSRQKSDEEEKMKSRDQLRFGLSTAATMNNAALARLYSQIPETVLTDEEEDESRLGIRNSMSCCGRHSDRNVTRKVHCDVFGPYFCTDCQRLNKRERSDVEKHQCFPNIDVHPRSLVAPKRVIRLKTEYSLKHTSQLPLQTEQHDDNDNEPTKYVCTENEIRKRIVFKKKAVPDISRSITLPVPNAPRTIWRLRRVADNEHKRPATIAGSRGIIEVFVRVISTS